MQQPQRFIPSVSDLYGTDEIEFLLDEIRDLEPACCQLEDVQDFEIAGSRAGQLSLSLDSPLGTVTSWDSHIHYRQRIGQPAAPWGVALHCDTQHLKTPTGIVRILLVLSSAACLACECSAGTVQVGLFLLPLIGRLRLMVFCALFSLLITCLMLFLDISHIALMFPFNWGKVNAYLYLSVGLIFILGASLLLHMVLYAESFMWVPRHTKDTLFVSALIGYGCALEALILSGVAFYPTIVRQYRHVPDGDCEELMFLDEGREMSPLSPLTSSDGAPPSNHNHHHHHHHPQTHPHRQAATTHQHHQTSLSNALGSPASGTGDEHGDVPNNHHHHNHHNNHHPSNNHNNHHHNNHNNHNNSHHNNYSNSVASASTPKPYIPAKRPDQVHNRRPTLGHHDATIQSRTSTRYRQGYHYQPIASTSSPHSPTFVLETRQYPHHPADDHDAIVDCPVSAADLPDDDDDEDDDDHAEAAPILGPPLPPAPQATASALRRQRHSSSSGGSGAAHHPSTTTSHQQQQRTGARATSTSSADIA